MTYFFFLSVFIFLPAVLLALLARPTRREWTYIALLILAAYVWTTPWDNYLVASGVWNYDPNLVLGVTLGWVPLEEYLFFGIMTVMSGSLMILLKRWLEPRPGLARALAAAALVAVVLALAGMRQEPLPAQARPWTYLVLIAVWAAPVVLGQIGLGWRSLAQRWPLWVAGVLLPTIYLTGMDTLALNAGTWRISTEQSLNLFLPGRVPVEEGIFFFSTNLMIVQGLLLALDERVKERVERAFRGLRRRVARADKPPLSTNERSRR